MTNSKRNANVVEALESAVRAGNHALNTVPDLMTRTIVEASWRRFVTKRGELVEHESFLTFLNAPPLKGIGISVDEARRLLAHESHALAIFDEEIGNVARSPDNAAIDASPVGRGDSEVVVVDARQRSSPQAIRALKRLLDVDPQLHQEVRSGRRSINSALIAAGLRPRSFVLRVGDASAAVRALKRHLSAAELEEIARLLSEQ